jgi:TIR domain/YARHG domain
MADVFISYSRKDRALVAVLARAVEAEGYDVWWDVELPPHQSYGDVITAKIAETKAAIVVWSADAVKSEWVRAEADMARNQRKLVQTSIGDAMPPLPFNQIQYAAMDGWQGEADHPGWRKVKVSLAELCGAPREGAVSPAPAPQWSPQPAMPAVQKPSKWPLYLGIAIAAVALVFAARVVLFRRHNAQVVTATAALPPQVAVPAVINPAPPAAVGNPDDEPAASRVDMVFPDSSTRLLRPADVAQLGPSTLHTARNEIYARLGRRFVDPELTRYFSQFSWYQPIADEVTLNPVEQQNVALLKQSEARYQ